MMKYLDVIKEMPHIHCARGPLRCVTCKELKERKLNYALIRVFLEPVEYASPVTEIQKDGERIFGAYQVLHRFADSAEATRYAQQNNIEIVSS